MLGAIIGDIAGSRFEFRNIHTKNFELFGEGCHPTDDTIMTIAVADAVYHWRKDGSGEYKKLSEYAEKAMRSWGLRYPDAGYGANFSEWLNNPGMKAYNSAGNGAAMRISPVGDAAETIDECIAMSRAVTEITHNHPDGIKGAEATALQIFLARHGKNIEYLRQYEEAHYYPIDHDFDALYESYEPSFCCDMTCQPAFICVYQASGFVDAIKRSISIGGDSDTIAAIAGGIAEAYWGISDDIKNTGLSYLNREMRAVIRRFYSIL